MIKTFKLDSYKYACGKCGKLHMGESANLDFDCVGADERSMGSEYQHEASVIEECDCGQEIEIRFEVWEYPEGVFNMQQCECDGGRVTVEPETCVLVE